MPYCTHCGYKVDSSASFCTNCGKPTIQRLQPRVFQQPANRIIQQPVNRVIQQPAIPSTAGAFAASSSSISSYSNPTFRKGAFENLVQTDRAMTCQGALNKTFILLFMFFIGAFISWQLGFSAWPAITVCAVLGLALALVISFIPTTAPYLSIVYSIIEGLSVGALSNLMERYYPGIVARAIVDTAVITFTMLFFYKTRLIQVTDTFKSIVFGATLAIVISQVVIFFLQLIGVHIPFIFEGGWISIGIGLVVIAVAAFNLAIDFHFFREGEDARLPSYFEWYAGFGLMVTLVWLYVSILRLLAILNSDD